MINFTDKIFFMKRILILVLFLIVIAGVWWFFFRNPSTTTTTENTEVVKKHSDSLNKSVDEMMKNYFELKEAFVDADTSKVKTAAEDFEKSVNGLKLSELQNDSVPTLEGANQFLGEIKDATTRLKSETDLTEMRHKFSRISENLYPLLNTIAYEGDKIYWQNCPMAFGDQEANWLSSTREIINPYLGKNHPEFKGSMLNCGEVKDSLYLK